MELGSINGPTSPASPGLKNGEPSPGTGQTRLQAVKLRRTSPLAVPADSIGSLELLMKAKAMENTETYPTDSSLGYGTLPRKKSSGGSLYSAGSGWSRRTSSGSCASSYIASKRSSRNSFGDISASESSDGALSPGPRSTRMNRTRPKSASFSSSVSERSVAHSPTCLGGLDVRKRHFSDCDSQHRLSSYWSAEDSPGHSHSASELRHAKQERELDLAFTELAIEKGKTAKMANKLEEQERERLVFACLTLHSFEVMRKEFEKLNQAALSVPMYIHPGVNAVWKRKANLPLPLEYPNATLWNGDVLVGGHMSGEWTAVLLRYNLATDKWTTVRTEEWLRIDSVFTYEGQLYVMAESDISTPGDIYRLQEKQQQDEEDSWEHVVSLPSAHNLGSVVCIGSQLIITGGVCDSRFTVAVDVYDFETAQWSCLPNLKTKRCFHSSIALRDNRVLVFGGTCNGGATESCEVEQFDLDMPESWDHAVTLPHLASALAVSNSVLFSCGGLQENGLRMTPTDQYSVWTSTDPKNQPVNSWISLPRLATPRAHLVMCFTTPRTVLAIGGVHTIAQDEKDGWSVVVEEITIP